MFKLSHKNRKSCLALLTFWFLTGTCCAAQPTVKQAPPPVVGNKELVRVNVHQLVVDPSSRQPVVTLADVDEKRALLIWIGLPEARAIYSELEGVEHQRPLTHDLLETFILKSKGQIHRIVVTHARENVFYATIVLQRPDNIIEIDARPSDALVMALKFNAPVYVDRDLFEKMSLPLETRTDIEESYGLALQALTPDLARYLSYESDKGIMVSGVRKGSQAEVDGIMTGDIIVEIDGRIAQDLASFLQTLEDMQNPLKARVYRNGRFLSITVHPD
jgi:bifunctional DNase/RNase